MIQELTWVLVLRRRVLWAENCAAKNGIVSLVVALVSGLLVVHNRKSIESRKVGTLGIAIPREGGGRRGDACRMHGRLGVRY